VYNLVPMSRDVAPTPVLAQVEKILASPGFVRNERLSAFLRFIVNQKLQGRDHELKETVIGVEVFGRKPDYEPRTDPVVRMEAAKLRSRIAEYYASTGVRDSIRIEIPKGGYVPRWETRAPHQRSSWLKPAVVAACVFVAITAFVLWRLGTTPNPSMVAVLPFADLEDDPTQRYFSQGVTEDIIGQLGQSGSSAFGVIAGPGCGSTRVFNRFAPIIVFRKWKGESSRVSPSPSILLYIQGYGAETLGPTRSRAVSDDDRLSGWDQAQLVPAHDQLRGDRLSTGSTIFVPFSKTTR
jgi:hypothetical protein